MILSLLEKYLANAKAWKKDPKLIIIALLFVLWRRSDMRADMEATRANNCEHNNAFIYETYRRQDSSKSEILRRQDSAKFERIMDIAAQNSYNKIFKPKIDSIKNL